MELLCMVDPKTREVEQQMKAMYGENEEVDGEYNHELAAPTTGGVYVGRKTDGVVAFKGIPYARQPVGPLRWKAPQPVEESTRVYTAYYFGHSAIQTKMSGNRPSLYPQGEDCLTLNIWTAGLHAQTKSPVIVFIYGGAFAWGGTNEPVYNGHNFVKAHPNVVMVTINYRLGLFGFIDFSKEKGGKDFPDSTNLGLLDQQEALRWVQRNIETFGGDPNNVTIMGESAGAGCATLLSCMDSARGLFKRVIAQSGSVALTSSRHEARLLARKLMAAAHVRSVDQLMNLSTEKLAALNTKVASYYCFAVRDGHIVPNDLYHRFATGFNSNIDFLLGTNKDELRFLLGLLHNKRMYEAGVNVWLEDLMKHLTPYERRCINLFIKHEQGEKVWRLTEFINDLLMRVPAAIEAQLHAEAGGRSYVYYWTWPSAYAQCGACHTVELAYVLNNTDETIWTGGNINLQLAKDVQQMWVNFATYGNPSTPEHTWPTYNEDTRKVMTLGATPHVENNPMAERTRLVMPLSLRYPSPLYSNLSLDVPYVYKRLAIAATAFVSAMVVTLFIRRGRR